MASMARMELLVWQWVKSRHSTLPRSKLAAHAGFWINHGFCLFTQRWYETSKFRICHPPCSCFFKRPEAMVDWNAVPFFKPSYNLSCQRPDCFKICFTSVLRVDMRYKQCPRIFIPTGQRLLWWLCKNPAVSYNLGPQLPERTPPSSRKDHKRALEESHLITSQLCFKTQNHNRKASPQ